MNPKSRAEETNAQRFVYELLNVVTNAYWKNRCKIATTDHLNSLDDKSIELDLILEDLAIHHCGQFATSSGVRIDVIGEERGKIAVGEGVPSYVLVIDPLDGSENAKRNIWPVACGVALFRQNDPGNLIHVSSGIAELATKNVVTTESIKKRNMNAQQSPHLVTPRSRCLDDSVIAVDLKYGQEPLPLEVVSLVQNVKDVRRYGADLIDMLYAAEGKLDAFVDIRGTLSIVHIAGICLAQAAGRSVWLVTDDLLDERTRMNVIIARTPGLMTDLKDVLGISEQSVSAFDSLKLRT